MRRNKPDAQGKHPWKAEVSEDDADVKAETITNWYNEVYEPKFDSLSPVALKAAAGTKIKEV